MKVYAGIDLHSSNSYVAVVDEQGRQVTTARVKNVLGNIVAALSGYVQDLGGVAVEWTYNWYWLVDGLRDEGFDVRLANPAAIQKYKGLKHIGDRHDALCSLLTL
ncbi:MAG: transposase [Thermodesulfobacteriota bacterium]